MQGKTYRVVYSYEWQVFRINTSEEKTFINKTKQNRKNTVARNLVVKEHEKKKF